MAERREGDTVKRPNSGNLDNRSKWYAMTLIASLQPRGCLTLIADVLVVSPVGPRDEIPLPTRVYIPPERMRGFPLKPQTFYRKVVELSPTMVLLWAGDVNAASD